jgi:hypothetical protein
MWLNELNVEGNIELRSTRTATRELVASRAADGTWTSSFLDDDYDDEKETDMPDIDPDEHQTGDDVREVPIYGRGTRIYEGVLSGDPVTGHDHDLTVYAHYSKDGFELTTHDDGYYPVDERHSALWVKPEHVPDLVLALGGNSGDDPVELLAQQIQEGVIPVKTGWSIERLCLSNWFTEHGVPYTTAYESVSNL